MSDDSKQAFTPGPWYFDGVCQVVEAGRLHMRVAFLPSDHAEYASSKANGHLIAAAPEMYEALKEMCVTFKPFRMKPVGGPGSAARMDQENQIAVHEAAMAVIAKATGASS